MSHEGSDSEVTPVEFRQLKLVPEAKRSGWQIRGMQISGALRNTQNEKHEQMYSPLRLFSLKCRLRSEITVFLSI